MGTEEPTTVRTDVWTVQRILQWTIGFLKEKGVESPRLEAELLLAHARNCLRIRLYTDFESVVTDEERAKMREYVQRRARREPLAYIVGSKEFYGRNFEVRPGILIPRPETETLIDVCLEQIPKDAPTRLLEVGVGSGCIAITLARQRPEVSVVATDISPIAIEVATLNSERHEVQPRIRILQGNCLQPIRSLNEPLFDGLVSNPPYIREDERSILAPEVAQHEPAEALFSGEDGLDVTRQMINESAEVIRPGGFIALELDPKQCEEVSELLKQSGYERIQIIKDLNGAERIVLAFRQ
ncbi:MAG: peptide chain release factor N(5)-glutamine methyltransferase [Planctomyces sp.]|nr:peptide chain release factor N(5)-glutamine methyltransferase [Planctomyces sp.]